MFQWKSCQSFLQLMKWVRKQGGTDGQEEANPIMSVSCSGNLPSQYLGNMHRYFCSRGYGELSPTKFMESRINRKEGTLCKNFSQRLLQFSQQFIPKHFPCKQDNLSFCHTFPKVTMTIYLFSDFMYSTTWQPFYHCSLTTCIKIDEKLIDTHVKKYYPVAIYS